MIKVEPCRGCGRLLYQHSLGGLQYRAETEPLDAQEAATALVGGQELYRVTATSVSTATPSVLAALRDRGSAEGPTVVRQHVCPVRAQEAVSGPPRTPGVPADPKGLPSSPVGRQIPSWGQSTECSTPVSAKSAVRSRSETTECSTCGRPIDLADTGTYALFALGATLVDAFHTQGDCTA
jgi:hypothetical protein